ncbi:MAG: orotidine-5'-phosphate decarboxylase [Candidatus Omnitrophota bacterium]|nr:MAG: orotidine-5'-phosphate decarboxylase [Candidatus Omnitrophota bacterium]
MKEAWDKVIVALDVTSEDEAKKILDALSVKVKKFKIGLIVYTKFGPKVINWVKERGCDVFLDFKLFDIPNTMIETAKNFIDLGAWAFTVHLKAGQKNLAGLSAAVTKEAKRKNKRKPLIIGVTELTSSESPLKRVMELAGVAAASNMDGVVCSVWEAKAIKKKHKLVTITPGIRNKKASDDQRRVATVKDAVKNKVDYFVVGRPIIKAKDYLKAAQGLLKE